MTPILWRERLVEQLTGAVRRPLTVVTAPPGYGKTVLVEQFLAWTRSPAARVTFLGEHDLSRGWHKVARGLEAAVLGPGAAGRLPALDPAGPADPAGSDDAPGPDGDDERTRLLALLDAATRLAADTVVVLDDLHRVRDPATFAQLEFLVNRLPRRLHLVAVSRQRLPLPLGRWRAQGRIAEIGPEDLRFRSDEVASLFEQLGLAEVGPVDVDWFHHRSDGWPIGLQLLIASYGEDRLRRTIDDRPARGLVDLVLDDQPPDVQEFILQTCLLRRFTAELCRAVTGDDRAGRLLETVEEANLFVTPLDETREWFRYQGLFAELMQRELERRHPGRAPDLHRRAAAWYEEHGDAQEALGHLVAAGRVDEAFALVNEDAHRSWREESLLRADWASLFSVDWVEDDPARMIYFATLLGRSGWVGQARSWIDRAEAALRDWPADDPRHGLLLAVRALWAAIHLDAERTVQLASQALGMIGSEGDFGGLRQRLLVAVVTARTLLDDVAGAEEALGALERLQPPALLQDLVIPALRARLAQREGQLRRADALGRRVLRTAAAMGLMAHPSVRDAHLAVAGVCADRGRLDEAQDHLVQALRIAENQAWPAMEAADLVELARLRALARSRSAGLRSLDDARGLVRGLPVGAGLVGRIDALEARIRLERGEIPEAAALADRLPAGLDRDLMAVRIALARRELPSAVELVGRLSPPLDRDRITVHLLAARVAAAAGQHAERDQQLLAAARLAEPEQCRLPFADEAPDLVRRLGALTQDDRALSTLVASLESLAARLAATSAPEPLTEREVAVLRYLPGGLSRLEIAAELEISTNTLKTHTRALFRKLGVGSRPEAVEVARRKGLL